MRTYISAPRQKARNWDGKQREKKVVLGNRRRVEGERGKQLLRRRGEYLERPFAHQYETGAMRRLHVRGRDNVVKRLLLQAAAYNLALILRTFGGEGTPRGLADHRRSLIGDLLPVFRTLWVLSVMEVRQTRS